MQHQTDDLRIRGITEVRSPNALHQEYPLSEAASNTVFDARRAIQRILHGEDDRLLVVVGPCSVHDPNAALEYAERLKPLREALADDLMIVMRVYFEKPRTTVGWKGLDQRSRTSTAASRSTRGCVWRGSCCSTSPRWACPPGTEFLDLISPQYIADLVSWGAIGARTTESQGHRELASGLSCPVGFKNAHRRRREGGHRRHPRRRPAPCLHVADQGRATRRSSPPPATTTPTSSCAAASVPTTTPRASTSPPSRSRSRVWCRRS